MKFVSFPDIKLFNSVIKTVKHFTDLKGLDDEGSPIYRHDTFYPKIEYKGTVKLHGSNAAVIFHEDGEFHCQSRENIITPVKDNAGFAAFIHSLPTEVRDVISSPNVGVFGEWCGGNIQKGVAINGLPKMFVIFKERKNINSDSDEIVWVNDCVYDQEALNLLNKHNIYHIEQFPSFTMTIDFEHPEESQNELIKITEEVERECPVGKYFGKTGIGEGVVWIPTDPKYSDSGYWHKVKGEKHQSSKIKSLAPIDVEEVKEINRLVEIVVTESRVDQGIQKLREAGKDFSVENMWTFLKWMNGDIEKEESEMLDKSGIERKKIHKAISNKARQEFLKKLN